MVGSWLHASPSLVIPSKRALSNAELGSTNLFEVFRAGSANSGLGFRLVAPVAVVFPVSRALVDALAAAFDSEATLALLVDEGGGNFLAAVFAVDLLASLEGWGKVELASIDFLSVLGRQTLVVQDHFINVVED